MTNMHQSIHEGMTPEERALERLNTLIDGGWQLNVAGEKISSEEHISKDWLLMLYEKQFSLNFIEEWREFCKYLQSKGVPMGKATFKGPVPPDDPIFNGGVEFFRKADSTHELSVMPQVKFVRRVTINWAGDELQMDLSEDTWSRIEAGEGVTLEELDENTDITYRWLFNVESGYSLIVDCGDPNHLRWLGQLTDAEITEIREE